MGEWINKTFKHEHDYPDTYQIEEDGELTQGTWRCECGEQFFISEYHVVRPDDGNYYQRLTWRKVLSFVDPY